MEKIPTHTYAGCYTPTAISKYPAGVSLALSNSLNNPNRTLSETEFAEMIDAIGTIKTEDTRKKAASILFRHIASISGAMRSNSHLS